MWRDLDTKSKEYVIRECVRKGMTSMDQIRQFYDNAVSQPQDPPFVQRYQDGQMNAVWDDVGKDYATHLLGYATDDNGAEVYPQVQPVDYGNIHGELKDYSNLPWQIPYVRAVLNWDTMRFPDEQSAKYYTEHYKDVPFAGAALEDENRFGDYYYGDAVQEWKDYDDQFKSGGKIRIKPSHRGRFTALKKRTGHSASWFKAHGTPAQRKMATFALNAKKWKHGYGGHLFQGLGNSKLTFVDESPYLYNDTGVFLPEVDIVDYAPREIHLPVDEEFVGPAQDNSGITEYPRPDYIPYLDFAVHDSGNDVLGSVKSLGNYNKIKSIGDYHPEKNDLVHELSTVYYKPDNSFIGDTVVPGVSRFALGQDGQFVDTFEDYVILKDDSRQALLDNLYGLYEDQIRKRQISDFDTMKETGSRYQIMDLQRKMLDQGFYDKVFDDDVANFKKSGKDNIKQMQKKLVEKGYYDNNSMKEVDGIVGKKTAKAYKRWLQDNAVDGYIGPDTEAAFKVYSQRSPQDIAKELGCDTVYKNIDTKGEKNHCAKFVRQAYQNAGVDVYELGIFGNAWNMPQNVVDHGGQMIYNIYDDDFKNVKQKDGKDGLIETTRRKLQQNPLDYSQLKVGDVVGIYIPTSPAIPDAIKDGTTKNTHVGIVDSIDRDGMPRIRHEINNEVRYDRANSLTGSARKDESAKITVAARPKPESYIPELQWNEDAKSDLEYRYEHPESVSEQRKQYVSDYMDGLAGAKEQIHGLYPGIDIDSVEKAAIGILRREGNFMQVKEPSVKEMVTQAGRNAMKNDRDRTIRSVGLKYSSLTQDERKMLGIKSRSDLENSLKKQAQAVMLVMSRNYDYFDRYSKEHPELGITDDEKTDLSILAYNQGMGKLYSLNPETLNMLRMTAFNEDYKYKIPYNESPMGQIARHIGMPDVGRGLYNKFFQDSCDPYVVSARKAMQNIAPKNNNMNANGGQIIWDNNGQWRHPGRVTGIEGTPYGTDITMNGVVDYLYGIDNFGNGGILEPGKNYHFPGNRVVEYPLTHRRQNGGYAPNIRYQSPYQEPVDYGNVFQDYTTPALLGMVAAGIPIAKRYNKLKAIESAAPYIQNMYEKNPENAEYLPQGMQDFIQDTYEITGNVPKTRWDKQSGYQYVNRLYKDTMEDKEDFVKKSFDDWYYTFKTHGHTDDDSIRMAKFFALQDAFESAYGGQKAFENNNYGGMNDVKEAKRQGVHFVPIHYNSPRDYYEAKYRDIVNKWNGVLSPQTVSIEQFHSALHADPRYQYAPDEFNKGYLENLIGMKSAQRWLNDYSNGYKPNFQLGGLLKPFSYGPIPVVRYGNGGNLYQGFGKSRLTFQQGKPYISNNAGTFLPEVDITAPNEDSDGYLRFDNLPEKPKYSSSGALAKDKYTFALETLPAAIASGALNMVGRGLSGIGNAIYSSKIMPAARQFIASELGYRGSNAASRALTGNTVDEHVGNVVQGITGWNPNNTWYGKIATQFANPFNYVNGNVLQGYGDKLYDRLYNSFNVEPDQIFGRSSSDVTFLKPEDFPQVNIMKSKKPDLNVGDYLNRHRDRIIDMFGRERYDNIKQFSDMDLEAPQIKKAIAEAVWDKTKNPVIAAVKAHQFYNLKKAEPAFNIGQRAIVVQPNLMKKIYPDVFARYGDDAAIGLVKSHELDHAINWNRTMMPTEMASPYFFDLSIMPEKIRDYFDLEYNTELSARGSQLKDYFNSNVITGDQLRYAARNYIPDTGIDNNMTHFFNGITDWDKMAKWITKNSSAVIPAFILKQSIENVNDNEKVYQ